MKIGILTYHRSHNYGALLQSIALRNVLIEEGHTVTFIDYWPGYHKRMYAAINWIKVLDFLHPLKCIKYIINRISAWKNIKLRIKNINQFINSYISPFCSPLKDKYDIIVCGSDQIWRKQPERFGYNPIYFGKNNIITSKKISYAASMGLLPTADDDKNKIKELVKSLDIKSVRENDLKDLLSNLGISDVHVDLDPTLLLTAKQWDNIISNKRYILDSYALFYEVAPDCFDERQMQRYCKEQGLKLVVLRTKNLGVETNTELCTSSPDKFVNLVRYADFVFTSSFHGLAFSIINHKQFICSVSTNKARLISLMDNLGISGHYLKPKTQIPTEIPIIDYETVEKKLSNLRDRSLNFLKQSIS